MSQDGPAAIVTGGASGIGRAIALRLAADGARVMVADLDAAAAEAAAAEIGDRGGRAWGVAVDVRDQDRVSALIAATEASFGPPEILITCAGVGQTLPILKTDLDTWERTLAVNLTGTFLCAKAAALRMVEEIADAAAFLVSDRAAYITGHMLDVDGGFDAAGMLFDLEAER